MNSPSTYFYYDTRRILLLLVLTSLGHDSDTTMLGTKRENWKDQINWKKSHFLLKNEIDYYIVLQNSSS